jgi:4-hydroxy-2-oxoglutarate aldolase
MSGRALAGVFAPVTTPFDPSTGELAAGPFRRNQSLLLSDGLAGVVVAGSTGEAPLLDTDEIRRLVEWSRMSMPPDRWLIVGTGAESTRQAIALARAAGAAGADLVIVRPPGYFANAHSRASLASHFRAVADTSPVPVLLYNIPKYTHIALEPELLSELSDHERIVGVKDSSGDLKNLEAYRLAAPRWAVLAGSTSLLSAAVGLGCAGGILGVSCFAAQRCVALYETALAGDAGRSTELQRPLALLDREIVGKLGPAGVKAAMDALGTGLYGGPVRAPLAPLSPADRERVIRLVAGD